MQPVALVSRTSVATDCTREYNWRVPALSAYLRNELHLREWSVEEFARRCVPPISTSLAYQITRDGRDNVRQSTFKAIAAAFGLSPSELHAHIGAGKSGVSGLPADEVELLAMYRRVAGEHRPTVRLLMRCLARRAGPERAAVLERANGDKRVQSLTAGLRRPPWESPAVASGGV